MTRQKNPSDSKKNATTRTTVNAAEVAQFDRLGDRWWDMDGPMRPLHRLNPVRASYIQEQIEKRLTPRKSLRLADIGCGGGILAEAMARAGYAVTGIDAGADNIAVAAAHAGTQDLDIDYRATTVEDVAATGEKFDVVTALEIIEHVDDVPLFVKSCCDIVAPGGMIVFSTLNRTAKSLALGVVAAEYILRWLPRGTHDWRKFVKPSELSRQLRDNGFAPRDVTGLVYRPLRGDFALDARDLDVNYLMVATRDA